MKEKSSHKRLTSNLITYGIVVAAFVIVQVLGATVAVLQYVRRSTELPGESPCLPYQAQQDRASDLQN